ncbi:uncharacterized protein LOC108423856 [Pygocentrus nattereri]|uniref:uncharacterized protein LOC108423856 n=1 Tax=Pygocentrus nattereri TaxID=42514 RepID=UPI0008147023|nr:uncharacterized protein LOC108423856 [Pygocentrus nattereri]
MAEIATALETESSTVLAPAVDISEGVTVEALQTLEEPLGQAALVMTEGDDSVFYSEDEEIPQEVSSKPVGSPSSPQIQNSGAEELVQSLSHSTVLREADSMHHSGAMLGEEERLMENKANHVSYLALVQEMEDETETASKNSPVHNEEPSKLQCAVSARAETAPVPIQDNKQIEKSLQAHKMTENPSDLQSGQASETQERDTARADGSPATAEGHEDMEELAVDNESSDHSRQAKYGTVSHRRIRRGLARQRIEEFEAMMQL